MRFAPVLGVMALLAGCAPPGAGPGASSDLEFRCSAESRMAASQGATRTDARLRALDTRRECLDAGAGGPPSGSM
jgi:hypothetical protein